MTLSFYFLIKLDAFSKAVKLILYDLIDFDENYSREGSSLKL